MLNNQNSIKVPRGFIRLSLLKVSDDTCRRSAAVFKYGKQSHWIGWPAFTLQKHSVNTDPRIQLPLCYRFSIKKLLAGDDGNTPEVTNP